MYNLNYFAATDLDSLEKSIKSFYEINDAPNILEIFTPTSENDVILKQYFKELI